MILQGNVRDILSRRNEVGNMDYMVEKFDLTKVIDRDVKVSLLLILDYFEIIYTVNVLSVHA